MAYDTRDTPQPQWSPRLFWGLAASSFALVQSCLGLFILGMAFVNRNPATRTLHDQMLMYSMYAIWFLACLMIIGAWRGWHRRILGVLASLILMCWGVFYFVL
jgi:hypothetical protein